MNGHQTRRVSYLALVFGFVLVAAAHSVAQKQPPSTPVDLNTATPEQLQQVPGIGPSTAKAIVNFRRKSGPFQRVEDLLVIKGVSKARFEKMRPFITHRQPTATKAAINRHLNRPTRSI